MRCELPGMGLSSGLLATVTQFGYVCIYNVVVRLSVHVHFNLGLSPRDSCVSGQCPSVCSITLTVSL